MFYAQNSPLAQLGAVDTSERKPDARMGLLPQKWVSPIKRRKKPIVRPSRSQPSRSAPSKPVAFGKEVSEEQFQDILDQEARAFAVGKDPDLRSIAIWGLVIVVSSFVGGLVIGRMARR